jgi:hypothetical protein
VTTGTVRRVYGTEAIPPFGGLVLERFCGAFDVPPVIMRMSLPTPPYEGARQASEGPQESPFWLYNDVPICMPDQGRRRLERMRLITVFCET